MRFGIWKENNLFQTIMFGIYSSKFQGYKEMLESCQKLSFLSKMLLFKMDAKNN